MPSDLPYLPTYKNVEKLFQSIASAKRPDLFTQKFLAETLGIGGTADRPLIALLKTFGFLDPTGKPTAEYDGLKNPDNAASAIGEAIRRAYAPLFAANEKANDLSSEQLKGLISQVAGTDAVMTTRIALTFGALVKLAKFGPASVAARKDKMDEKHADEEENGDDDERKSVRRLRPEFHYNIQVHLPANATEETYVNIFEALRKVFR